jgi:formylglycine-generating enzyme required for sulfatase activity
MPYRTGLFAALMGAVVVIPTRTAPRPLEQPIKAFTNSIGMKLVRIEPGKFMMGSHQYEAELPHEVKISKPFYMGAYPVRQAEYEIIMESTPSWFSSCRGGRDEVIGIDTSRFPVETVSWNEAVAFCEKLSERATEKKAGRSYRLPTEAEWEYGCRAGTKTKYHSGKEEDHLKEVAWYDANSGERTHPVGEKKPNAWGLYDMHGNVYQWCSDWYGENFYLNGHTNNPAGPKHGTCRVVRGGCWAHFSLDCRAANRGSREPSYRSSYIGFRVVCTTLRK